MIEALLAHNVHGTKQEVIVHATGDAWYARLSKSHLVLTLRLHETPNETNTLSYFVHE